MIKIIHAGEYVGEGWRVGTQLRASRRRPWMAGNIWDLKVNFLNSNLYMKETNVFIFPLFFFCFGELFCLRVVKYAAHNQISVNWNYSDVDYWTVYSQIPDNSVTLQFHKQN